MSKPLVDPFGRQVNYLRISVTDKCNLKCVYCRPHQQFKFMQHQEILRYEEIYKLVRIFVDMGVNKVRLTGGEPLVRKDLEHLIQMIRQCEAIQDLSLTTNGILLGKAVEKLKKAGLMRVNISLDTLDRKRFIRITGVDALHDVLNGIEKSIECGLSPIKVNAVLLKDINDHEIEDFVELACRWPIEFRFIELMPTRNCFERDQKHFFSNKEAKERIFRRVNLLPMSSNGVAEVYQIESGKGRIGFISPLSCTFCSICTRIRLKADGFLKLCLHGEEGVDLRGALREGKDTVAIKKIISNAIKAKPKEHRLNSVPFDQIKLVMTQVGG